MTRSAPRSIYVALLPTFALLIIFNYWPIASAFFHSFFRWGPGGVEEYIGLDNFARLLHDSVMWKSFINLGIVMAANLTIKLAVPLATAVLIFHLPRERWRYLYRVLFVVPMVVPSMVVILLWQFVYADRGLLQALLESARLEGAGWWRRFWRIELPLLLGQLRVVVVPTMIGAMQGYELFLILTRGGPGYSTIVPGLWMYLCGFSFNEMGCACSIGVVLFLAMFGLTALNLRLMKQEELA
ncbi:MAG: carbohydrate ABC transporter permease [Candidatus Oleimicrobiaceae bacterium]